MSEEKKSGSVWLKIAKLFLEFLIAAITAYFASGCVTWLM